MLAIFMTVAPVTSDSQFTIITFYDGQWITGWLHGELVTLDVPALDAANVDPGPYPYEFNLTEPLHVYLQIRHSLGRPAPGEENNLTIYLDDVSILEADTILLDWYPGGDGIELIDLGTLSAGTHYITMSAASGGHYGVNWWKILAAVEAVETLHTVYVDGQPFYITTATGTESTTSNFMFDETFVSGSWMGLISFDIAGPSGTTGFCNITIPMDLMRGEQWLITINGTYTPAIFIVDGNGTHTFLYFTYSHNAHIEISGTWVVPEFPSTLLLPLLVIVTLVAVILKKKLWPVKHGNITLPS